jgi:hypothetical protein
MNHKITSIFKLILLVCTLSVTQINADQANINYKDNTSIKCGIENDKVATMDYSICKEDLSFRAFYEIFPDMWENTVFSFHDFEYLSDLKKDQELIENTQHLKFSLLFQEIFKVILEMSMLVIFSIIIYFSFMSILKSLENGEFMGQDWKIGDLIKSATATTVLLLPVGNFLVIHVIVLSLTALAISLANYMYGFYLSSVESSFLLSEKSTIVGDINDESMIGHNKFYSYNYVSNMANIELCRKTTSHYQMENIQDEITQANFPEELACFAPSVETSRIANVESDEANNIENKLSFINYNIQEFQRNQVITSKISNKISFGLKNIYECNDDYVKEYDCNTMKVTTPNINGSFILKNIIPERFNAEVNKVIKSLSYDSFTSNEDAIKNGWNAIHEEIKKELNKILLTDPTGVDILVQRYIIAKRVMENKDTVLVKYASYIYHQMIMNHLMMGTIELKSKSIVTNVGYNNSTLYNPRITEKNYVSSNTNIINFLRYYKEIEDFSSLIYEYQCLFNTKGLSTSINFLNKISVGSGGQGNLRCIDFKEQKVYGTDSDKILEKEEIKDRRIELLDEIKEKHKYLSEHIYNSRVSVENSFFKSINDLSQKDLFKYLRQQGWLNFSSYLLKINQDLNTVNNLKIKFVNSVNFENPNYNSLRVSNDVYDIDLGFGDSYGEYKGKTDIFKNYSVPASDLNQYVDSSNWSKDILINESSNVNTGEVSFSDYFRLLSNPLKPLKESIGLSSADLLSDESRDLVQICEDDPSTCPIPRVNPFIQLNNLGHYFINTSLSYYSTVLTVGLVTQGFKRNTKKNAFKKEKSKRQGGSLVDAAKKKTKSKVSAVGIMQTMMDMLSSILSFLNKIVFIMLLAGLLMAYVIPLLPFVYYMMAFLSWFLLVIQLLFISPIWVAYLLKFNENKDELKKFAFDYGMQVLFKPLFMVITLIFIWSLYSALIFFVNLTIMPLLASLHTDGFLTSIISSIILMFILTYVIFILTSRIFELSSNIYDKIFKVLGASTSADDNNSTNELLKFFAVTKIHGAAEKAFRGNPFGQKFSSIKKQAKNKVDLWEKLDKEKNKKGQSQEQMMDIFNKEVKNNPNKYGQ